MANRWKGNFVVATAATSSGTAYTGKADGAWGLNSQLQQKQGNLWAAGITAPTPPINVTATATNAQATVSFTPQATGGGTVTYTVTSTPENITATGSASPITVTGLTNGTSYTFKVKGTNTLGYTGQDSSASNSVVPVASLVITSTASAPYIDIYNFTKAGGFGSKVSVTTVLSGAATKIYSNSAGTYLCLGGTNAGLANYYIYPYGANGLGTRVTTPSPVGTPDWTAFTPNDTSFLYTTSDSPYVLAYPFSGGSLGTKYANPASLPTGACRGIAFNSTGNTVILTGGVSPYLTAYPWNNGFGTKFADPATLPTAITTCVAFKNTNVVFGQLSGVELQAYPWNNGFGTKFASPTTRSSNVTDVKFNAAGTTLIAAYGNLLSTLSVFPFSSSGFGTRYADPASLASYANAVTFNAAEDIIFSPDYASGDRTLAGYPWNNGFGTRYAKPTTNTSGIPAGITVTPF